MDVIGDFGVGQYFQLRGNNFQ